MFKNLKVNDTVYYIGNNSLIPKGTKGNVVETDNFIKRHKVSWDKGSLVSFVLKNKDKIGIYDRDELSKKPIENKDELSGNYFKWLCENTSFISFLESALKIYGYELIKSNEMNMYYDKEIGVVLTKIGVTTREKVIDFELWLIVFGYDIVKYNKIEINSFVYNKSSKDVPIGTIGKVDEYVDGLGYYIDWDKVGNRYIKTWCTEDQISKTPIKKSFSCSEDFSNLKVKHITETEYDVDLICFTGGYMCLSFYNDALQNMPDRNFDIQEVYECTDYSFKYLLNNKNCIRWKKIWDRKDIEKEMTMDELCELLGYKVIIINKEV